MFNRALTESRRNERTKGLSIPKLQFAQLVEEIALTIGSIGKDLKFQTSAISALQEAAEAYLVMNFESELII